MSNMEWMHDNEFVATWIGLVVEAGFLVLEVVFLILVFKEFKYLKQEAQERRQRKIKKRICELCSRVIWFLIKYCDEIYHIESYKTINEILYDYEKNNINDKIIEYIYNETKLNKEFIKSILQSLEEQYNKMCRINYIQIKELLIEDKEKMKNGTFFATDIHIEKLKKQFFKKDEEIERLYKCLFDKPL